MGNGNGTEVLSLPGANPQADRLKMFHKLMLGVANGNHHPLPQHGNGSKCLAETSSVPPKGGTC